MLVHFGNELPLEQRVSDPFVIEAAPARPSFITSIEPAEGARVDRDARVRVAFDFRRHIRFAPESLRLYVDGNDVTAAAERAGTDDVPQSQAEVWFSPRGGWSAGLHSVKVDLGDATYSWLFMVDNR